MKVALLVMFAVGCGSPHSGTGGDVVFDPDAHLGDTGGGGDDGNTGGDGGVDGSTIDGPPTPACPNWCAETAPAGVTTRLYAVWAIDTSDVFVVGDAGVILRRRANAWTQMTSGTVENLRGVWGASSSDVWAVGENGTILRFNGTTWSPVTGVTTSNINTVWGSGPSDVWMAGPSRVYHYTGAATIGQTTIIGELLSISGTGPNDIWLTGENTYTHHYAGSWTTVMPGNSTGPDYYAIHAITTTNVWASTLGTTLNDTGGSPWAAHATPALSFQSLYGGATDLWGAGGTSVGHWNGTAWTSSAPLNQTQALWGVHGSGADIWVVGSGATILHHN